MNNWNDGLALGGILYILMWAVVLFHGEYRSNCLAKKRRNRK